MLSDYTILKNKLKTIYLKPVLEIYTGDADDDNWRKTLKKVH